mgnify:CR=1 FL=1
MSNNEIHELNERINDLIIKDQEQIKTEKKFMGLNKEELKRIITAVGLSSIEDRCGDIARRIDSQEQKIDMMDYFIRELKWIKGLGMELNDDEKINTEEDSWASLSKI